MVDTGRLRSAVIVVSYNSARWLAGCLADLSDSNVEQIIVVDNASTDESCQIAGSFERVTLITNANNEGFAAACNIAVAAAESSVHTLIFLNPDTRLEHGLISGLHEFLESHEEYGVVGPLQLELSQVDIDGPDRPPYNAWTRKAVKCFGIYPPDQTWIDPMPEQAFRDWLSELGTKTIDVEYVNGAAFAIRKDLFASCGGFDTGYFLFFEEVDLCRRVRRLGYKIALIDGLLVRHAWGGHAEGRRLRFWLKSKYRYIMTDASLPLRGRAKIISRHLKKDFHTATVDKHFRSQVAVALLETALNLKP
jgi:N-acetylglucosaminyl-diphospho-decaprenol L-rhamnosyltransferase